MKPAIRIQWQRHGLTALLAFAAFGVVVALGYETGWGQALRPPLPAANKVSRAGDMVATLPGFNLPPLDSAFKETGERPLFTPTRRPAAVNLANAPAMKKGQFRLSGTSVNNDLTVAFLLETATGKTVRITKGKEINGMILDTVEPNRVLLRQGDETEELVLRTASSPPVNVAAPAPGNVPSGPGVAGPGTAGVNAGIGPQSPRPIVTQPAAVPNPLAPAPGSAVLPGFVMPSAPTPPQAQAAPPPDAGSTAQRRRRIPTPSTQ